MGNNEANAGSVAKKKTGKDLLTHDICVNGHDIRDKAKSIAIRKRYQKQAGEIKYTCRRCETERTKLYYKHRQRADLINLIQKHPELVEVLTKVAQEVIGK
jgi:purine nucleoside permease